MRFTGMTSRDLTLVCSTAAALMRSATGACVLSGSGAWAQQSDLLLRRTTEDRRRQAQDSYHTLANQVFLLERQQKALRSKVKDAEATVSDLRAQLRDTEQELEQVRQLVRTSRLSIDGNPGGQPPRLESSDYIGALTCEARGKCRL
jgi:septal ring factor EnvC (AmiA/AmiB activator)